MDNIKCYETRLMLVNTKDQGDKLVIFKTYIARSRYEAVGKAVAKLLPQHGGYYLKSAVAYYTKQRPIF